MVARIELPCLKIFFQERTSAMTCLSKLPAYERKLKVNR